MELKLKTIADLTLLDCYTNRSYKDSTFIEKRNIIIKRESNGLFVPLCTKNVFLKTYSEDLSNMSRWEENDKYSYIKNMEETLESFFKGGFINE